MNTISISSATTVSMITKMGTFEALILTSNGVRELVIIDSRTKDILEAENLEYMGSSEMDAIVDYAHSLVRYHYELTLSLRFRVS